MSEQPLNPVGNGGNGNGDGRRSDGTFGPGNKLAKGNPLNRKAQVLRSAYIRAVSKADMRAIVAAVLTAAKAGDIQAAKELCDRVMGKAVASDLLQRIEALESALMAGRDTVNRG